MYLQKRYAANISYETEDVKWLALSKLGRDKNV